MDEKATSEMKEFRGKLGITQEAAAPIFGTTRATIAAIELGYVKVGWQRHARILEAVAAFESGGVEAVAALPPFKNLRVLKTIPGEDANEMARWREDQGLSRWGAARRLGFTSAKTIAAIENGKRRITERVRQMMKNDEKKWPQEDR